MPGKSFPTHAFPWLLPRKVAIPDRVAGYLRRPELERRTLPTRRGLTVLRASGGFGKTTLMAECCRSLRRNGVPAAWISLDENDEPGVLDVYVAFACASAGLNLLEASPADAEAGGPASRAGAVLRAIESFGKPFVIAFDELERSKGSGAVRILTFLLERGPANLHLAFACREVPDGLDVASPLLSGRADLLDDKDLRFSRAEVARFFDLRLSRRALAKEIRRSAGWPFALRVSLNGMRQGAGADREVDHRLLGNWIESRLFAQLGPGDRDFVLDAALFEWIDPPLLDEALGQTDSFRRLESMAALTGLLEPVGDGRARRWRLHPLVRDHCAGRRRGEDPERFAAIHRRIAAALASRGETMAAMRHAVEGGDPSLAGGILEQAGGVRLWIRQGVPRLLRANRLLSEEVVRESPRLALLRCVALALAGSGGEARALYRRRPRAASGGDEDDLDCFVHDFTARFCLSLYGAATPESDWSETLFRDGSRLAAAVPDPATRGGLEYGLCVLHFLKGEFDLAADRLSAAVDSAGTDYIVLYGEILLGQIDFVRGRPADARAHYRKARRIARKCFLADPTATTSCDLARREVALECNLPSTGGGRTGALRTLKSRGVPFSFFATAANVLIGDRLRSGHAEEALAVSEKLLFRVRRGGLTAFARLTAALHVSMLTIAGRAADAERAWRREGLPESPDDCVDPTTLNWREMEAVAEARSRLLIADRRFDEARSLLRRLRSVSSERGLRTVEMRALALSVVLEGQAGETPASRRHLTEYLTLFSESPYAWPLVRDREASAAGLRMYLDRCGDDPHREAAGSLLAMCEADEGATPSYGGRELQVLRRLTGRRDKEIAAELGLSVHGVRHHLRSLFAKLGVRNRAEAVRRAREKGLIPDDP